MALRVGYFLPAYGRSVDPGVFRQAVLEGQAAAEMGYRLIPSWLDCNGVDIARNKVVDAAIKNGIRWLFMQDSDVWATSAVIPSCIDIAMAKGAAAVVAPCALRRDGLQLAVDPVKSDPVYRVRRAGTGLMLVDIMFLAECRSRYSGPFFRRTFNADHTELDEGGDVFFSSLVNELGGEVWVNGLVETHHVYKNDVDLTVYPTAGETAGNQAGASRNGAGEPAS